MSPRWPVIVTEAYSAREDINEAPNRYHHEEADEAPEHKILALGFNIIIVSAKDKGLEGTPEEDDKRDGEENGDKDVIDGVDNKGASIRDVVNGSRARDKWQSE